MRNIDDDLFLRNECKRYWNYEITYELLRYKLNQKYYADSEINQAIADYYLVYIYPYKVIKYSLVFCAVLLLLIKIIG